MKKFLFLFTMFVCFTAFAFAQRRDNTQDPQEYSHDPNAKVSYSVINLETGEEEELPVRHNLGGTAGNRAASDPLVFLNTDTKISFSQESKGKLGPVDPKTQSFQVIGKENWYQVKQNRVVAFKRKEGWGCSGALVGPYTVLTAAHCVIDIETGKRFDLEHGYVVYPGGADSGIKPIAFSSKAFVLKKFSENMNTLQREYYDYAIAVLKEPVGNRVGYYGIEDPFLVVGTNIAVIGFPGYKKHNRPWYSPGEVTFNYHQSDSFHHDADTQPGSSGSPIFKEGDTHNIVAIHTAHTDGAKYNIATRPSHGGLIDFVDKYKFARP